MFFPFWFLTESIKTQRVQTVYCDFLSKEATYLTLKNHNFQFLTRLTASLTDDCHLVFCRGPIWIFLVENPGFPLNKRGFDPVIHPGIADDDSHKKARWRRS